MSNENKLDYIIERLERIENDLKPIQEHVANVEGAFKLVKGICLLGGLAIALARIFIH